MKEKIKIKILCLIGFHKWEHWSHDRGIRTCLHCNKMQYRDIRDLMWLG
jgi:hypothetical protein